VALWLPNSREWALSFCACARIGAVVVPINTRYTAPEAAYLLRQSDARLLILMRRLWGKDYAQLLAGILTELGGAPVLRTVLWIERGGEIGLDFESVAAQEIDRAAIAAAEAKVTPRDALLICYTSGTTGKPKGAMHDHRVIKQATRVGRSLCLEPGGAILGHMPLYHVAGLYMALMPAMTLGGCFVNMQQWDAGRALELMEQEKVTCFGGIPTHFVDLVNDPSLPRRNLPSLKVAWIGGSPVMQATYDRYRAALGLRHLLSTYGMTENTISTTFNRLEDPRSACSENRAPVLGATEVRVVDPASGRPLPAGEVGEVWCRGETVMMGYYKDAEATRAAITQEGWLKTGDLGRFDGQGFLSITGRLREMFKSGGTNVYPVEIEQHLSRHPAVRIAAVIGVPDERLGEVGVAFVEVNEGCAFDAAAMREHCKGVLADYKIPRHLQIVEALPRTTTGKIQKSALKLL
jgi:fatty-acyl-CoA synthase